MAPHATTKWEKQEWITFLKMPEEEDHYCVYTTWFESSPGAWPTILQCPNTSFVMNVTTKGSWHGLLSGKHTNLLENSYFCLYSRRLCKTGMTQCSDQEVVGSHSVQFEQTSQDSPANRHATLLMTCLQNI